MTIIDELEFEWNRDAGFLGQLRDGTFDQSACNRLIKVLNSIDIKDSSTLDHRLVALLWFIPTFIEWQEERYFHGSNQLDTIRILKSEVIDILLIQLGAP